MYNIFIGFDRREIAAYQVCAYSIIKNSSVPVSITPLNIRHFPFFRNTDFKASTEFAFTRFLVPYLSNFEGRSLFMDCDMLVRGDIAELFDHADNSDVQVVKHKYKPKEGDKFLGAEQTLYEKKNWSSVMLFNNEQCKALTKNYVNTAGGLHLHQFEWAKKVGELPKSWNYLVGEDIDAAQYGDPDLVHYTIGGPYFQKYDGCQFSDDWWEYFKEANSVLDTRVLTNA